MVIHCSGGIGRSGTFTALYSLYRLLLQYQQVTGAGGLSVSVADPDQYSMFLSLPYPDP
jgi:protein tyrosine phosphatase